jgi:hypothetical protein
MKTKWLLSSNLAIVTKQFHHTLFIKSQLPDLDDMLCQNKIIK